MWGAAGFEIIGFAKLTNRFAEDEYRRKRFPFANTAFRRERNTYLPPCVTAVDSRVGHSSFKGRSLTKCAEQLG